MAATNRYMNFGAFSFNAVSFAGVTDFNIRYNVSVKKEGSDADPGPTIGVVDYQDPAFDVTTFDAFSLQSSIGGRGIFSAVVFDAYNKGTTGGGGKTITTNALTFLSAADQTFRYREYGTRTLTFECLFADPATPPYSVTAI